MLRGCERSESEVVGVGAFGGAAAWDVDGALELAGELEGKEEMGGGDAEGEG